MKPLLLFIFFVLSVGIIVKQLLLLERMKIKNLKFYYLIIQKLMCGLITILLIFLIKSLNSRIEKFLHKQKLEIIGLMKLI